VVKAFSKFSEDARAGLAPAKPKRVSPAPPHKARKQK
jgi:hypothetical protein